MYLRTDKFLFQNHVEYFLLWQIIHSFIPALPFTRFILQLCHLSVCGVTITASLWGCRESISESSPAALFLFIIQLVIFFLHILPLHLHLSLALIPIIALSLRRFLRLVLPLYSVYFKPPCNETLCLFMMEFPVALILKALLFYLKCAQGLVRLEIGRLRVASWLSSRKDYQGSQVRDMFFLIDVEEEFIYSFSYAPSEVIPVHTWQFLHLIDAMYIHCNHCMLKSSAAFWYTPFCHFTTF